MSVDTLAKVRKATVQSSNGRPYAPGVKPATPKARTAPAPKASAPSRTSKGRFQSPSKKADRPVKAKLDLAFFSANTEEWQHVGLGALRQPLDTGVIVKSITVKDYEHLCAIIDQMIDVQRALEASMPTEEAAA